MNGFSRRAALFASALAFLTVASACSNNQESTTSTEPPNPTSVSGDTTTTTVAGPAKTGNAEIDALLEASRAATYHVVYADQDGQTLEIYRDGGQTVLFSGGQGIYQLASGENAACEMVATPTCFALPDDGGSVDAFINIAFEGVAAVFVAASADPDTANTPTEITNDFIAERQAKCINVTLETTAYSVCIDAEIGIFLKIATTQADDSKTEFVARKVEVGNVDATIFELPAPLPN